MTIREVIADLFDELTGKQIFVVVVALILVAVLIFGAGSIGSAWKIRSLENRAAAAKERADALEQKAAEKEKEAEQYKAKIQYLEGSLVEKLARTQDENLQALEPIVAGARNDAERARGVRRIASTADELCNRLREVGHPCTD